LPNRAHAYKAAVEVNTKAGKPPAAEINAGLFNFPDIDLRLNLIF